MVNISQPGSLGSAPEGGRSVCTGNCRIARLAQCYVMRKADPTLPRYGSDLVANALWFYCQHI
jgi:hypothetical protein